jgi:signal transduction histidine kinase
VVLICFTLIAGFVVYRLYIAPFKKMKEHTKDHDRVCDELERSREREIELRQRQTELFADLGRQLKDPLEGIGTACDLIKTKIATAGQSVTDDGFISQRIDSIERKADKMGALVNDMLTSALDELGEFKVDCADTESRIIDDMIKRYDDRDRVVAAAIPYVLVHIDANRMSQVIGNIIDNSYKYANTPIEISYLLTDDYLQMRILDHGPGVADDETELVTNRFYRSRQFADDGSDGRGLGLYAAKTIMEKMGGQLLVENTGEGFCVTLLIKLS